MKYLLDTCVYLWIITNNQKKISKKVTEILNDDNEFYISIISQIETTVKHAKHHISGLDRPIIEYYQKYSLSSGINFLNLSQEDVEVLHKLPNIHQDPFDRLLVCQAISNGMTIISPDEKFSEYPVRVIY